MPQVSKVDLCVQIQWPPHQNLDTKIDFWDLRHQSDVLTNRQNESLILWSQTPSWTGKMCTFNYFRVVKIRSKCKFFPECWFHKAEKGQIFRCSLLVLGSKLNLKFRRSSNFWMLNMQSFKQKINILPSDFPIELSVFNSFDICISLSLRLNFKP